MACGTILSPSPPCPDSPSSGSPRATPTTPSLPSLTSPAPPCSRWQDCTFSGKNCTPWKFESNHDQASLLEIVQAFIIHGMLAHYGPISHAFRQREYRKPCLNQNKMGGMGGGPGGAGGIGDRGRQGGMNPSWNGGGGGAGGGLGMGGMGGAGNPMGGRVYFSIL